MIYTLKRVIKTKNRSHNHQHAPTRATLSSASEIYSQLHAHAPPVEDNASTQSPYITRHAPRISDVIQHVSSHTQTSSVTSSERQHPRSSDVIRYDSSHVSKCHISRTTSAATSAKCHVSRATLVATSAETPAASRVSATSAL